MLILHDIGKKKSIHVGQNFNCQARNGFLLKTAEICNVYATTPKGMGSGRSPLLDRSAWYLTEGRRNYKLSLVTFSSIPTKQ